MKNLGLKEQIFIAIGVNFLIVILCVIFLWKPQLDKIGSANAELKNKEAEITEKKSELEERKKAKLEAPKVESQSLNLSKSMPEEEDIPSLMVEMDQVANETNIKILKLKFTEPVVTETFSTIDYEGEMEGTYFNLADFFYEISQMPRQVKIKTIELEHSSEGYPLLIAKIKLATYAYTTKPTTSVVVPKESTTVTSSKSENKSEENKSGGEE